MRKTVKDIFYNAIYQVFLIVLPLYNYPQILVEESVPMA